MKQPYTFSKVIQILASQSGEEKLRTAFDLTSFVIKLREEGARYGSQSKRHSPRSAS